MSEISNGFLSVFEQRCNLLRKRLKEELHKKKSDRNKELLKSVIKEIKEWESFIRQHKKTNKSCPHCGGLLD